MLGISSISFLPFIVCSLLFFLLFVRSVWIGTAMPTPPIFPFISTSLLVFLCWITLSFCYTNPLRFLCLSLVVGIVHPSVPPYAVLVSLLSPALRASSFRAWVRVCAIEITHLLWLLVCCLRYVWTVRSPTGGRCSTRRTSGSCRCRTHHTTRGADLRHAWATRALGDVCPAKRSSRNSTCSHTKT